MSKPLVSVEWLHDNLDRGDIRIDATTDTASIAVNENIKDVNLAAMAKALFDVENITGMVNGTFELGGRGKDMNAIRRDLDGNMSIELADGAWEGTDVWYELRKARSLIKGEPEPEAPELDPIENWPVPEKSGPYTSILIDARQIPTTIDSRTRPSLATWSDNVRQLDELYAAGVLDADEAELLRNAYRKLRQLAHRRTLEGESALYPEAALSGELRAMREGVTTLWHERMGPVRVDGDIAS